MTRKDKSIVEAVKLAVWTFDPTAKVVLFGSRARGNPRQDSDYDFLVLLNIPLDFKLKSQILDKLYDIELNFDCILGVLIENSEYWKMLENTPIFSEIAHEGITV
jgi:predicted nucleotidyltransferase